MQKLDVGKIIELCDSLICPSYGKDIDFCKTLIVGAYSALLDENALLEAKLREKKLEVS